MAAVHPLLLRLAPGLLRFHRERNGGDLNGQSLFSLSVKRNHICVLRRCGAGLPQQMPDIATPEIGTIHQHGAVNQSYEDLWATARTLHQGGQFYQLQRVHNALPCITDFRRSELITKGIKIWAQVPKGGESAE